MTKGTAKSNFDAELQLPPTLDDPGILVAWSLEHIHKKQPIGFGFGNRGYTPKSGYLDPILFESDGHLLTIAPTGAGKGTGCVIPTLLRYEGPVIVIDPKGENVAVTARRRQEMGHEVIVLDPMGVTDFKSHSLNPLDVLNIDQLGVVDDVAMLSQVLLGAELHDPRNQYWINRGMDLINSAMLHMMINQPDLPVNLSSVRQILSMSPEEMATLAEALRNSPDPDLRMAAGSFGVVAPETMGSILSLAHEGLDFVRGQQVREATDTSSFSLDAVTRGDPLSIYIVIPPEKLESHAKLLRLWISVLIGAITRRRGPPPTPTLFILDEAAQLGNLRQLRQAITLLRGYGLRTWSFWQDPSQLHNLYPRDWPTMVNNCKVLQTFGATNMSAARTMADLTGFFNPSTILDLDHTEMIVQIAGDDAVIAQKPCYLTDPCFDGMFDQNPLHDPDRDILPKRRRRQRHYIRPEDLPEAEHAATQSAKRSPEATPDSKVEMDVGEDGQTHVEVDPGVLEKLLEKWK